MKAFTIIRVSAADQLRQYGPDSQWQDDVLPNAASLGLEVTEGYRRIIQESASGWDRPLFEAAVQEAEELHARGEIEALVFPRVDRETRFLFGSLPILASAFRAGLEVFFSRERFRLDPQDPDSMRRYLWFAQEAAAYIETMRINTMAGRKRRAVDDGLMPQGGVRKWAFEYHPYQKKKDMTDRPPEGGRYTVRPERVAWIRRFCSWILDDGASLSECCRRYEAATEEKFYVSVLGDVLRDPALLGKFYAYKFKMVDSAHGKKRRVRVPQEEWLLVYEDPSQAVITEAEFHALQACFRANRENASRNTRHEYPPLRRLVRCRCSSALRAMQGHTTNYKTQYYRCPLCKSHVNSRKLWAGIKDKLTELLLDPGRMVAGVRICLDSGVSIDRLAAELALKRSEERQWLDAADDKVVRLYLSTDYPFEKLQARRGEIALKRESVAREVRELEVRLASAKQAQVDEEGLARFCRVAARNLENIDDSRWRRLLELMRLQVYVNGPDITVSVAVPALAGDPGIAESCWGLLQRNCSTTLPFEWDVAANTPGGH